MSKPFYDVFISHAYEDQNEFTGQLAHGLKNEGLSVWYSGFELSLGASIADCFNEALSKSRCGVVLISPVYLTSKRAMKELEALFSQETQKNRLLPVLNGVPVSTYREKMPLLADRYVVSSRRGVPYVVTQILQLINAKTEAIRKKSAKSGKPKKVARRKVQTQIKSPYDSGVIVLGGVTEKIKSTTSAIKKRLI